MARPHRSDHDQSLRGNHYKDEASGTPGHRAFGYYGGIPHQANLEDRRISAELAGISLICYVAGFTHPHWTPTRNRTPGHIIQSATEPGLCAAAHNLERPHGPTHHKTPA